MAAEQLHRPDVQRREVHLVRASEHLDAFLETVDLDDEPGLADAVIDAVRANDRAYELSTPQHSGL